MARSLRAGGSLVSRPGMRHRLDLGFNSWRIDLWISQNSSTRAFPECGLAHAHEVAMTA